MGLHFPIQQVELAKQQRRGQGTVEAGIGRDDPLQGAHLGDERGEGGQLEVVKLELAGEIAATGRIPDIELGVDVADLLGGKVEPDRRLLALEVHPELEALVVGLELVGHEGARRGAHGGVQGRLVAAPAGPPVGGEHRLPAEVIRQPGPQALEVELVEGKLQAALLGRYLAALDAEAGPLGTEAEIPHGQPLTRQIEVEGPGRTQLPAPQRCLQLELAEGAAPALPAQTAAQLEVGRHRVALHGERQGVLVEIAAQVERQLAEAGRPLYQAGHRQGHFPCRLVTDQGIALDGDPLQIGAGIIEAAGRQICGHPRRLLIAGQAHLSLDVPLEAGVEPGQVGGVEIRIQFPRLLAQAALGLQLVGAALQRQRRDGPLHLVVAARAALDGQRILVELAIHLQLGQLQLPVARLIELKTAGNLARQRPLELGHQLGRVDPLEFRGALPAYPLVPGELAVQLELPLEGVEQQVDLVQLRQIPLARQHQLEGGHVRALAGGIQGKLVAGELALGTQTALVQPVAGLIFGRLVQRPTQALPLQPRIKGQVGVEGRQRALQAGGHRPLGLQRQCQLAHRTAESQAGLLPLQLAIQQPLAGLGIQSQGERIIVFELDLALERQIRHGVAQGELAQRDIAPLGTGRQQQLVEPFNQFTLLIAKRRDLQSFQLDGERQPDGGQRDGGRLGCLLRLALIRRLRLGGDSRLGSSLVLGACLGDSRFGSLGGLRLGQGHLEAIQHGPLHDQPLAAEGGADVEGLEAHPHPGHCHIEIRHLEAVDLNFQGQRVPDEGL